MSHGVISTSPARSIGDRLKTIYQDLVKAIELYTPMEAAIEDIFLNKNPNSTLKLGMARGISILASSAFSLPITEYSPNKIKKSVVGTGHADKNQVSHMIKILLPKAGEIKADAADALAVAICHAHHRLWLKECI